jgi:tRNA G10  N-methylase Trm11
MIDYAAICAEGLEDTLLEELMETGKVSEVEKFSGIIVFCFDGGPKDLEKIKAAEDIMIFLKEFSRITRYKTALRSIRHETARIDIRSAIDLLKNVREYGNKFSVKATYIGRRDYKAAEIEEAAAVGIINSDKTLTYDKGCSLLFRLISTPEISFLGLCLEATALDDKNKVMTVPGSLRPSVANALLRFAEIKEVCHLLDPMCGTGIIPIEAARLGAIAEAGDIEPEKIRLAEKNASNRKSGTRFHVWDARNTGLEANMMDRVVSNLPFEKQAKIVGFDEAFFCDFLKEMVRVTKNDAIFVFLTKHEHILTEAARKNSLEIISMIEIKNSGLTSNIVKLKKIN